MRVRFESRNTRTYKIISVVLAFAILVTSLGLWYNFASNTVNKAEAAGLANSITVNSDFFDYYYDNQILGDPNTVNQGETKQPYSIFNEMVSTTNNQSTQPKYVQSSTIELNLNWWSVQPPYIEMLIYADGVAYRVPMYRTDTNSTIWTGVINGNLVGLLSGKTTFVQFEAYPLKSDIVDIKEGPYNGLQFNVGTDYTMVASNTNKNFFTVGTSDTSGTEVVVNPTDLVLPLYFGQYWIKGEDATSYTDVSANSYGLTNFTWGANLAARPNTDSSGSTVDNGVEATPQFYAAALGLVDKKLNSNEDGTHVPTQGGIKLPYFDKEWLITTTYNNKAIANIIENVQFQFDKKTVSGTIIANQNLNGDYYVFDSAVEDVYVAPDGKFTKTSDTHITDTQDKAGFFPFNNTESTDKSTLNYGFGSRFDIPFTINEYGTVDGTENGDAVKFAFKGDDDVWVYVDGQLALDLGGAHKEAEGVIDFKAKKVYIRYAMAANTNTIKGGSSTIGIESKEYTFEQLGLKWNSDGEHTLTMFYMERGMINSNLYVQFNMAVIPNENTLTIESKVDADNVNNGLKNQTLAVADSDVMRYTISNKGTGDDDVTDSGLLYPTTDFIRRNNTTATNLIKNTLLSGQTIKYDTDYFYFEGGSSWTEAGAVFGAWLYADGKTSKLVRAEYDSATKKYRVKTEGYENVVLIRFSPDNGSAPFPSNTTTWPYSTWGQTVDISGLTSNITGNTYYSISESRDGDYKWTGSWVTDGDSVSPKSYVFKPSSITADTNGFKTVSTTNYSLSDPFTQVKNGDNWTAYSESIAGQTSTSGTFDLMYSQSATFTGQFKKGSTMKVTQSNVLYAPSTYDGNTVVSFAASSRNLATYYTLKNPVAHDDDNNAITVNSDGTYAYGDAESSGKVHITEVYERSINTGDLSVTKKLKNDESSSESFTMKLTLTNLFGSSGTNVTDYSGVTVSGISQSTLNSDGTFTIKAGETAKITGIPVGTVCTIAETSAGNSFILGSATITDDNTTGITVDGEKITVTNTRKTGSLVLSKVVENESTNTDSFTFTVNLTAPTGENVDFSNYTIKVNGTAQSCTGSSATITASVKQRTDVTISGIPYGTTYTVTEAASDTWTSSGAVSGTVNSDSQSATITNTRKTGSLELKKELQDGINNPVVDADKSQTFDFTVTLTASAGVDLSKYSMKYTDQNGTEQTFTSGSTVLVSKNKSVTIKGIPYGTTYTVTETTLATDYTQSGSPSYSDSNRKIDTDTADTVTITNKKKDLSSDAYLIIEKYIDKNYYYSNGADGDNAHNFANDYSIMANRGTYDSHGYLAYTNAEQMFTFEIYDVTDKITYYTTISTKDMTDEANGTGDYELVGTKKFKVQTGHTYEVKEITGGISWRYEFEKATGTPTTGTAPTVTTSGQTVTVAYSSSAAATQEATASFYNKRTDASKEIESDMSSITNKINAAA